MNQLKAEYTWMLIFPLNGVLMMFQSNNTKRKCTLGKVNDKSYVIYLHKTNVIDPFCDSEIFLVVPGVWLPT